MGAFGVYCARMMLACALNFIGFSRKYYGVWSGSASIPIYEYNTAAQYEYSMDAHNTAYEVVRIADGEHMKY